MQTGSVAALRGVGSTLLQQSFPRLAAGAAINSCGLAVLVHRVRVDAGAFVHRHTPLSTLIIAAVMRARVMITMMKVGLAALRIMRGVVTGK